MICKIEVKMATEIHKDDRQCEKSCPHLDRYGTDYRDGQGKCKLFKMPVMGLKCWPVIYAYVRCLDCLQATGEDK